MSIWTEGHEHMLVRFWIRDGEREYNQFAICHKDDFPANDKQLIQMYVSDDITEYEEGDELTYWVHYMEALCQVQKCYSISRETKELLNSFGVY
jgi:hypothetical protein